MSSKEIQERHDTEHSPKARWYNGATIGDIIKRAEQARKDRGELLDALREIGELVDGWRRQETDALEMEHCALNGYACARQVKAILDKL